MRPLPRASIGLLLALQGCAAASLGGGRFLASGGPDLTGYQLARESELAGPLAYETHAVVRTGARGQEGWMAGAGLDLTVLSGHADNPYLIGGVQAGFATRDHPTFWSSWSIGAGQQLLRGGPVGLRAEVRYRRLSADSRQGVEIGFRIGRGWRSSGRSGAPAAAPVPGGRPAADIPRITSESTGDGTTGARRAAVAGIAIEVMGTPYRWGGTDANGFDCSGLIQFAYGEVGVTLPRRSVDQARAGRAVSRELGALLAGDILTFATQGGDAVTHVGLYLGNGRFIHSATGGVQVSVLSAGDPYGRWWFERWTGARRIME